MLGGGIHSRYTCHGADISPQLRWHNVPSGTKELLVFVRTIVHGKLRTNWALGGVKPSVTHIAEGVTPVGAVVARNSFGKVGYSLCPPRNDYTFVTFAVYALPHRISLKQRFDPESVKATLEKPEVAWGGLTMVPYPPHHG